MCFIWPGTGIIPRINPPPLGPPSPFGLVLSHKCTCHTYPGPSNPQHFKAAGSPMSICPAKHWLLWWLGVSPFLLQTLFIAWLCCTWNVHVAIVHIFFHTILYIPPFTPMHLENRMILKKFKSKLFSCARKKVKVFLPTPIFRLVMTNLHRRVTVGERTSCRAILSLPAPTDQVFKGRHLRFLVGRSGYAPPTEYYISYIPTVYYILYRWAARMGLAGI